MIKFQLLSKGGKMQKSVVGKPRYVRTLFDLAGITAKVPTSSLSNSAVNTPKAHFHGLQALTTRAEPHKGPLSPRKLRNHVKNRNGTSLLEASPAPAGKPKVDPYFESHRIAGN